MKPARKYLVPFCGIALAGGAAVALWIAQKTPGESDRFALAAPTNVGPRPASEAGVNTAMVGSGAVPSPSAAEDTVTADAIQLRVTACLSDPNDDERQLAFLSELSRMRPADAEAFLQALKPFRDQGVRREEWSAFFRKWGEIDPTSAIAYLDQHKAENWAANTYQQVLRSWGTKDAARAQAWLNERSGESYFDAALLGYLEGFATWDSEGATETAIASLAGASDRLIDSAMEKIATSVFRSGFSDGLKQWFDGLPAEGEGVAFRKGAMRHVYSRLLQKDSAIAADWIAQQASTPWRADGIIAEHAARMAASDPKSAMEWVSSMPPSQRIRVVMGVGEVVREWSRDPGTFEPWLNTVRGTQVFEQAARDYAILIAKQDPAKALFWATQVTDPHWRSEALEAARAAGAK
jgi:hypothetical protein